MIRTPAILAVALLSHASAGAAQGPSAARQIFASDTVTVSISSPMISPDERWLVFVRSISNQESRVMIRPMAGGEIRELVAEKGLFSSPRFTPQGDRLLFTSDLPRHGASDDHFYLVSAPFDTRTGVLTAPIRQVSLDGIEQGPQHVPAISPDGRWVAYMEWPSKALRIVPIEGGNARTLVAPGSGFVYQTWSPDGRSILYETRQGREFVRRRVALEGGASVDVVKSREHLGFLSPDNRYSFTLESTTGTRPRILHVFAADGRPVGDVAIPREIWVRGGFAVNGKYLLGSRSNAVAPIKVVPVNGGPIRQITSGAVYDWADSWTPDGEAVYVWSEADGRTRLNLVTRTGEVKSGWGLDMGGAGTVTLGTQDGQVVYVEGSMRDPDGARVMAQDLKDGSRRVLASGVRRDVGSVGPGGMYYGSYGGEFYFNRMKAERWQIWATNIRGASRVIGEVPTEGTDGRFAVYQDRIAYIESVGDSMRLKVSGGPGRSPRTLGTFPKTPRSGEMAWSYDGRQLAIYWNGKPQTQYIYRFDASGAVLGTPLTFTLPFEYWYETFWLPDGSGLTMIAQPRGMPMTHIALVKLSDPEHPILLTKADTNSKWGHSLSPDGKYVAYPSQQERGSSIFVIDVPELVKQAKAKP